MVALAVARYLQDATGISIRRVIHALKPLQKVTINLNDRRLTATAPLTSKTEEIIAALHIPTGHQKLCNSG